MDVTILLLSTAFLILHQSIFSPFYPPLIESKKKNHLSWREPLKVRSAGPTALQWTRTPIAGSVSQSPVHPDLECLKRQGTHTSLGNLCSASPHTFLSCKSIHTGQLRLEKTSGGLKSNLWLKTGSVLGSDQTAKDVAHVDLSTAMEAAQPLFLSYCYLPT